MVLFTLFFFCYPALAADCNHGAVKECVTPKGCEGIQVCDSGEWSECKVEEICEPTTLRECIPEVNGVKCPEFETVQRCNRCGTGWRECGVSGRIDCCPGQTRECDSNGVQECTESGEWGLCFDGQSCQGVECEGGSTCENSRCAMGECVLVEVENCCTLDYNCPSTRHCVNNRCVEPDCNECARPKNHQCVPRENGVCCNGRWNSGYDSCELNYKRVMNKVISRDDSRALNLFEEGVDTMYEGYLGLAEEYFESAELSLDIFRDKDDYNSEVLSLIDQGFLSLKNALKDKNFSGISEKRREIKRFLKLEKPPEEKKLETPTDSNKSETPKPTPEEPSERPWIVIILLSFVLVFLFILLILEIKKRRPAFFFPE